MKTCCHAFCLITIALLGSCMPLGINLKYATPRKASRLPSFNQKDSLKGSNNGFRAAFDVKHYRIDLSFNPKKRSVAGSVKTRFELLNDSKQIQLDLDKKLTVDSVTASGLKLNYQRKHTALFISLPRADKWQEITVHYHGKPRVAEKPPWEGGFVWEKDKKKRPFAGVACEGEGAGLWLPVKGYLGDEPDSITCIFSCPVSLTVVSNGQLISSQSKDGFNTFQWQTSYPVNPYNITFYLGAYCSFSEPFYSTGGDTVTLSYYVLRENESKARSHFEQVKRVLKTYEDLFGPYPWPRDGFKLVESPYAGMEHQTAIAYGSGYKNDMFGAADYIIVHEAAHEWWGNAVSVADFSDVWLHEGFATYAEALFMEQMFDHEAYLVYMKYVMMQVMNRKSLIGPRDVYYWDYKDADVYMKGAAILHTLRNQVADDTLFSRLLRTFYEKYRYRIVSTADFASHAGQITGLDLSSFFAQYLYRRESPLFEWTRVSAEGQEGIRYLLKRAEPGLKMRVRIASGEKQLDIIADATARFLQLPAGPVQVNSDLSYMEVREVKK